MKDVNVNEKIVHVISLDPRYRAFPFGAMATESGSLGTFLTGQHVDPLDDDTLDGLTVDEMRGDKEITPLKRARKFHPILNPDVVLQLVHGRRFNLTIKEGVPVNQKDYWEYKFFSNCVTYGGDALIAPSKAKYVPGGNYFYVEDKEAEAIEEIAKTDVFVDAMIFIKTQVAISQFEDIALLLNHRIDNFNIDVSVLTPNQVQQALYTAAKNHPKDIISCDPELNPKIKKELFILKLQQHGIISYEEGVGFSDGNMFIGETLSHCVVNLAKDSFALHIDKWGSKLNEKEKNI